MNIGEIDALMWQFFIEQPFVAFIAICALYYTIKHLTFTLPNRIVRGMNIRKHGWPPAHLDADGNFIEEERK